MSPAKVILQLQARCNYLFSLPAFRAQPLTTLFRALVWRVKCALGLPAKVWVPAWRAHIFLEPEWHGAGVTLFYVVRELYEPELTHLGRFLEPGNTFIDAGANCGLYTVAAARIVGEKGEVLAFEPGPSVLGMLERNVAMNNLRQVSIFRCALGAEPGRARLYNHPHGASSASLGHADDEIPDFAEVDIDTLDAVLARSAVSHVDVLKMDVEGAEELILQGAVDLFARTSPVVLFEINRTAIANLKLKPDGASSFLAQRGFRFFQLSPEGRLSPLDLLSDGVGNVVALHWKTHANLIAKADLQENEPSHA